MMIVEFSPVRPAWSTPFRTVEEMADYADAWWSIVVDAGPMPVVPAAMIDSARVVAGWSMSSVHEYLYERYVAVQHYSADADTELMGIIDEENRAAAVLYRAGFAHTFDTTTQAIHALRLARTA